MVRLGGARSEKVYDLDIDTLSTDFLEFTGDKTDERYSGQRKFTRTIDSTVSELVTWRCNSTNGLSDHVIMNIVTKGLKRKKYVRLVSNGNKYYEIRWFKYETMTAGDIAGIVIGSILLLAVIVVAAAETEAARPLKHRRNVARDRRDRLNVCCMLDTTRVRKHDSSFLTPWIIRRRNAPTEEGNKRISC